MKELAFIANLLLPADYQQLRNVALEYNIPPIIFYSHAVVETGWKGGNSFLGPGKQDTIIIKREGRPDSLVIGPRRCREIGRMQINPCDDKGVRRSVWGWLTPHCRLTNLTKYDSNLRCGAAILAYRHATNEGSWFKAIERYNGTGPKAREYRERVERLVGRMTIQNYGHAEIF